MFVTCWSAKGGVGVSVVSAALAGILADRHGPVVLADLGGDLPAVLGMPEPVGPGLLDWAHSDAPPEAVRRLAIEVVDGLHLLPRGEGGPWVGPGRARELAGALGGLAAAVVVDAGEPLPPRHLAGRGGGGAAGGAAGPVGPGSSHLGEELRAVGTSLFVATACYLGLRRAMPTPVAADGVVFVKEPGRALDERDVANVLGLPVLGVVEHDPAVMRAVDSGSLVRRLPGALRRGLRDVG